jgi:serine/threonine protein kinase
VVQVAADTRQKCEKYERELEQLNLRLKSLYAENRSLSRHPWYTSDGVKPDNIQWIPPPYTVSLGDGGYKKWEQVIYKSGPTQIIVAAGVTGVIKDVGDFVRFFDEVRIHRSLKHPGVINTYGGFIREDNRGVFITEFAEMDLAAFVKKNTDPGEPTKFSMIDQLISVVNFFHECGLVHGDLKLSNILVFDSHTEITPLDVSSHSPSSSYVSTLATTFKLDSTTSSTIDNQLFSQHLREDIPTKILTTHVPPQTNPNHKSHFPVLKITDFSTMAPTPSGYDSSTVPISHAEGYHSHSTPHIRPPESKTDAPMPPVDLYALGFVVAAILLWEENYQRDVISKRSETLDIGLRQLIEGLLNRNVDDRWGLPQVRETLGEYGSKSIYDSTRL